jgi:DNA modification methylase
MAGLEPVIVPKWRGCLGLEEEPRSFVGHIVHVFREVRRVLADSGTLWLNIGDSYAGSWGGQGRQGKTGELAGRGAAAVRQIAASAKRQSRTGSLSRMEGLKNKDLIGIPWRVAFALQADGWHLRSDIIWAKPNPMPESVRDRPTKAHEYLFLFTKCDRYFYDAEAAREPDSGRAAGNGFSGRQGRSTRVGPQSGGTGSKEPWSPGGGRNTRSVWPITTQPVRGAHFATMPPALAERCVLAGTKAGDWVLDPFSGAGTTGLVSLRSGRRFVGVDLSPKFCELALKRWRTEFHLFLPRGAA